MQAEIAVSQGKLGAIHAETREANARLEALRDEVRRIEAEIPSVRTARHKAVRLAIEGNRHAVATIKEAKTAGVEMSASLGPAAAANYLPPVPSLLQPYMGLSDLDLARALAAEDEWLDAKVRAMAPARHPPPPPTSELPPGPSGTAGQAGATVAGAIIPGGVVSEEDMRAQGAIVASMEAVAHAGQKGTAPAGPPVRLLAMVALPETGAPNPPPPPPLSADKDGEGDKGKGGEGDKGKGGGADKGDGKVAAAAGDSHQAPGVEGDKGDGGDPPSKKGKKTPAPAEAGGDSGRRATRAAAHDTGRRVSSESTGAGEGGSRGRGGGRSGSGRGAGGRRARAPRKDAHMSEVPEEDSDIVPGSGSEAGGEDVEEEEEAPKGGGKKK